jgi:hypothetical protein
LQGILICGALGAAVGAAMSGPGTRLARVLGGGIGGIVAGDFALASGEVMPPGTIRWAPGGAAYAAVFALPAAALVGGMIGWINPASGSVKVASVDPTNARRARAKACVR